MELKWIRAFTVLAKYLNYNKAAASLYISQPTLSKYILLLEENLGVRLFDRNKKRVVLTLAGQKFLPRANEIVRLMDEVCMEYETESIFEKKPPVLKIGLDKYLHWCDYKSCHIGEVLEQYKQKYPDTLLQFVFQDLQELINSSKAGTIDAALTILYDKNMEQYRFLSAKETESCTILSTEMCLLVPGVMKSRILSGEILESVLGNLKYCCIDGDTEFVIQRLAGLAQTSIHPVIEYLANWGEILTEILMNRGFAMISLDAGKKIECDEIGCIPYSELGITEQVSLVAFWQKQVSGKVSELVNEFLERNQKTSL